MIFWKSWNWPSYSREWMLDWLRWHVLATMSLLTGKNPKSALRYLRLWKWRHIGTLHWGYSSGHTDYGNCHMSDFKIQNTLNTSHYSQHKMNRRMWCTTWIYWVHSDIEPFGCQHRIVLHCITLSQCAMTCLITWMAWCELLLRSKLNGNKTCSLQWSYLDRSCPNTPLK